MSTKNQEAINAVLSKLTIEERELLGLIKKPKKPRVRKNYTLKIFYMIGDSKGHTDKKAKISASNPFLKPLTEALDKLEKVNGCWGIGFESSDIDGNREMGRISDFEQDLLLLIASSDDNSEEFLKKYNYEVSEQNYNYIGEFYGLLRSETEYSFLVYEGYELR